MEFSEPINYNKSILRLSDFRKKLIILDLWNHQCSSCVESFPKLESLQKEFPDQIQIIAVNRESRDSTLAFFSKRRSIKLPSLTMISGDTMFARLFSPNVYPYAIWIDSNAVVKYISGGYNTTGEHISAFLNELPLEMKNASLEEAKYDPIIENVSDKISGSLMYYSYVARCIEEMASGNTELESVPEKKAVRMSAHCSSMMNLFVRAFNEYDRFHFNTMYGIELIVKDTARYKWPSDPNLIDSWMRDNCYTYEMLLPAQLTSERYKYMQSDLNRYFSTTASVEIKKIKSVVMVRISKKDLLKTKGGKPRDNFSEVISGVTDTIIHFINQPYASLSTWLKMMNNYYIPFCDETGYSGNIDIELRKKSFRKKGDITELRKDLLRYGLDLKEELRPVPVLVIKELY